MTESIGVRFKSAGEEYNCRTKNIQLGKGNMAKVETSRGIECGEVVMENRIINDESVILPLKDVIRKATHEDGLHSQENKAKEQDAFLKCEKKIEQHKLDMKLVDVE